MGLSKHIDETVQQSKDFIDDNYINLVGLKKPSMLVYDKAIEMFVKVSRLLYRKFPHEDFPELQLNDDGCMIISWHTSGFEKKYVMFISEVIENDEKHVKIIVNKNFDL